MPMLTLFCLACLGLSSLANATDWQTAMTRNDITVYSRPQQGSDFAEFKATMLTPTSLQQTLQLITNTKATVHWLDHCKDSRLLARPEPNQALVYTLISAPWPLQDRDTVVHFTFEPTPNQQGWHILMQGKPDILPEQKNTIRIRSLTGDWLLEAVSRQQTRVTYRLRLNPGGDSPAWLVNAFSSQGMYQTLANLRRLLTQPSNDLAMQ